MEENKVVKLHLDDIIPNRFQPREVFDERALKELAVSIKEHGVIQPIIVREINGGKYEIIAGERRYKASALAGETTIPAIIRNLDDKEAAKVALLENLQRKNLNPIEEARTYQKILELDNMTQEDLARTMGKSQSAVANKLRLLSLPDEVQNALLKEEISERHARALLNLDNPDDQIKMLHKITKEKMTVRKVEDAIKEINMRGNMSENNNDLNNLMNNDNTGSQGGASFLMNGNNNGIVNYGEIHDNEDDPVNDMSAPDLSNGNVSTGKIDIESLMKGSKGIGNINSMMDDNISPAEKALKESESKENSGDYFSAPDLMNVKMPDAPSGNTSSLGSMYNGFSKPKKFDSLIDFTNGNKKEEKKETSSSMKNLNETLMEKPSNKKKENESLGSVLMQETIKSKDKEEEYGIRGMVEKIRATLKDLEAHGAKIDTDEMNFENQYQILIKIDKNNK